MAELNIGLIIGKYEVNTHVLWFSSLRTGYILTVPRTACQIDNLQEFTYTV